MRDRFFVWLVFATITANACQGQRPHNVNRESIHDYFVNLAQDGKELCLPSLQLYESIPIGSLGVIDRCGIQSSIATCRVAQHVDEGTLVYVDYFWPERYVYPVKGSPKYNIYSERREIKGPFLFRGTKLRELGDEATFLPGGIWEVNGTYEYVSVIGAKKTVISLSEIADGSIAIPVHPLLLIEEVREWKGKDDQSIASGVYAGYEKGTLKVMNSDGEESKIRLTELSRDDQSWIRDRLKLDSAKANAK